MKIDLIIVSIFQSGLKWRTDSQQHTAGSQKKEHRRGGTYSLSPLAKFGHTDNELLETIDYFGPFKSAETP